LLIRLFQHAPRGFGARFRINPVGEVALQHLEDVEGALATLLLYRPPGLP
jgi:hypothetical protein